MNRSQMEPQEADGDVVTFLTTHSARLEPEIHLDLLRLARLGDERAREDLIRSQFGAIAAAVVRWHVLRPVDSDNTEELHAQRGDVASIALTACVRAIDRWSGEGSLDAYATAAIRNAIRDHYAKELKEAAFTDRLDERLHGNVDASNAVEPESRHVSVDLSSLRPRQRAILNMYYGLEGERKRLTDIAAEMNLPTSTVARSINQGRERLRKEVPGAHGAFQKAG